MRISTLGVFERSVRSLMENQSELDRLQERISSGKKIINPSDDPTGAAGALNLRKEINTIDQFLRNSDASQSALELEDSILTSVTRIYQRVRELSIAAGSGSLSFADRSAIADEMQERLDELVSVANSKNSDGDFVFSGFNARTQAVEKSLSGQYLYNGDEGEREIQLGQSTFVRVGDSGKNLFFDLSTSHRTTTATLGVSTTNGTTSGLINSGTIPSLDSGDLIINGITIATPKTDGLSNQEATKSAIAIANAINAQKDDHGVDAIVNSNSVNLGVFTAGSVNNNELVINGVEILDPVGTESSLMNAINNQSDTTGVVATQPGGAGTDIVLTAQDGRNIHLVTDGTSAANFANFDLTGGALDQVQRGSITLRDHNAIDIQGANPQDVGLTRGLQPMSANTGTGVIGSVNVISEPTDPNESYSIIFNAGGTTFDIVADSNPSVPLDGFDDVTFVEGQNIEFAGYRVLINGTPNAGDVFGVESESPATQDVFTSIERVINSIREFNGEPTRLSYEIDLILQNLDFAENKMVEVRAQLGAKMNIVESQSEHNQTQRFIAQQNLSSIEDLDYNEAITELSQRSFVMQAVQQTFARIQSLSLFNFLS